MKITFMQIVFLIVVVALIVALFMGNKDAERVLGAVLVGMVFAAFVGIIDLD